METLQNNWEYIVIIVVAIVSTIVAGYIRINSSLRCTLEIQAQFVKFNYYCATKGRGRYCPVFRYVYHGMTYENQSPAGWSERKRPVLYAGELYPIRINPKKPERISIDKKLLGKWKAEDPRKARKRD